MFYFENSNNVRQERKFDFASTEKRKKKEWKNVNSNDFIESI